MLKRLGHIAGMIADGEHTVSPLDFQRKTMFFKKMHCTGRRKYISGTRQKFSAAYNIGKEIFRRAIICQIAPPLPCDINFLSEFFILFQQEDAFPGRCRCICRHQSGRPSADHYHSSHICVSSLFSFCACAPCFFTPFETTEPSASTIST